MKLLILGAGGATGALVVKRARAAGHDVVALVRDESRYSSPPGVSVVEGDATVAADVARAADGVDAIISALGSRKDLELATKAARVLVPLSERESLKLVVLSAFGVGSTAEQASRTQRFVQRLFLKKMFADKAIADDIVRHSAIDYTLVYPTGLTDKPATGRPRIGESLEMTGLATVSRADVAGLLVAAVTEPRWSRRTVLISD